MRKQIALLFLCFICITSCTTVKQYQRVYINDPDMVLGSKKVDKFETNFHAYRESASGANGGKTGGGCGCN